MSVTTENQSTYTLSPETLNLVPFIDEHNYAGSYIGDAVLPAGIPVELKATGKVGVPAAETSLVIGILRTPCEGDTERCTVVTQFKAIVKGEASGAVTIGDQVYCDGLSSDSSRGTFATIASTGAVGTKAVALSTAVDTAEVIVGIL